ncbi:hypothetical protein Y032_0026g1404 [Ancylostoma ceylanicum]|uniref:Small ribosomal subunit protein uS7 domain-containing protein n=1 Tax=Ancylostoma ceylanicum TaxID=53326 RepID=A0A016UWJ3_9BILA|nr:hypothetical protein Y032_0026g1404 [Ancylostoma ceylanicum]
MLTSRQVDKLTRVIMNSGRKETARYHVYAALEIIKRRQYKAWLKASEEEKSKIELDPFVIARKAIANCHPLMKLQGVTRVVSKKTSLRHPPPSAEPRRASDAFSYVLQRGSVEA